ncbi:MAG TPA: DUF1631 family protein [Porticoccaceae bacterium]|nr:DUF1631 family protein [Porticoccaceae bacterium]
MGVNAQAALRMLRERARQFVTRGMAECCRCANDELFAQVECAEDAEDQTRYMDAMRIWHGAHRMVGAGLARRLDQALGGWAAGAEPAGHPAEGEPPRWIDGEDLTELIRIDAMAAAVRTAVHPALAELIARVETLTGTSIPPRQFAFAPDFVLSAFAREISALGLDADARRILLRSCQETLLEALSGVVAQANGLLRSLGVALPADGRGGMPREPDVASGSSTASASNAASASAGALAGTGLAAAGEGATAPHGPPRRGASLRLVATLPGERSQVDAAELSLAELPLAELPLAELLRELAGQRRNPDAGPPPGLLERAQAALASRGRQLDALHPLDLQLLRLIDALFGRLAEGWMPQPLRELLAGADVAIAALASRDPQFLDKPWHPGRRLLAEIIVAASDLLDPDDYHDAELFRCAAEMIAALGRLPAEPRRLAQRLVEFVAVVERAREHAEQQAERILQEAGVQERANVAHGRVAAVVGARLIGRNYPLALLDLVERAWCRVLFLAWFRYGDSAPQWHAAVHLLDQLVGLLGDAQPDADLVERLWLALGDSLDRIAFNRFEARRLLDDLRGCLGGDVAGMQRPGVIWAPEEARELGDPRLRVAIAALRLALPGEPEAEDHRLEQSLSDVDLSRTDSLRPGGWIEIEDDATGERMRARLLGVVQPSGMHLLDAGKGGIQRVPKRRLALALKEGRLLARDNSRLFEQALDRALEQVSEAVGLRQPESSSATIHALPVRRTL